MRIKKVIFPHKAAYGGPGAYQNAIEKELKLFGIEVGYYPENCDEQSVILVVNGTRKIFWLIRQKFLKRSRIYLRVDGKIKLRIKSKEFIIHLIRTILIKIIKRIANGVIYQSNFSLLSWRPSRLENNIVIYNGHTIVESLKIRSPNENLKIIVAEGAIQGQIAQKVLPILMQYQGLGIFGQLSEELCYEVRNEVEKSEFYKGVVTKNELMDFMKNKKAVYFSLELDANCPNVVIEAMSHGLPVISFNTGAIPELISEKKLLIDLDYLEAPDLFKLINDKLSYVEKNFNEISKENYDRQSEFFSVSMMTLSYVNFMSCK